MDEQMIADMRDAMVAVWDEADAHHGIEETCDVLARAAHSVIAGKVAELIEVLDNLRLSAERVANKYGRDPATGELLDWTEWQNVRDDCERAAALAPYPERRSE